MSASGGRRERARCQGGQGSGSRGVPQSRKRNSSQGSGYKSTFTPDVVRYFKVSKTSDRYKASVVISYEENDGDTIMVIDGNPASISAAVKELQKEAGCAVRASQTFTLEALESFKEVNHCEVVRVLQSFKVFAGWHACLDECKLYTFGRDQTVAHRAMQAVGSLINKAGAGPIHICVPQTSSDHPMSPPYNQLSPHWNPSPPQWNPMLLPWSPTPLNSVMLPQMVPSPPRWPTSPTYPTLSAKAFTDRFELALECLCYMKTMKASTTPGVMINQNTQNSCIEVSGDRQRVLDTIENLHRQVKSLATQNFPKSVEFLDCLKHVKNKVVNEALRAAQVKAGWDIRDQKLWVCSDSNSNVHKAEEAISALVACGEFPANGSLTAAQVGLMCESEWVTLTDNLKETYASLQLGFDAKSKKIYFALLEKSAGLPVTTALDKFFSTHFAQTSARIFLNQFVGNIFAARSKSLERDIQSKEGEQVHLKLSRESCDLSSSCNKSLRHAEDILRHRISQATTADLPVSRPSQCDWLDSNEGKRRVEDICTLTKTIHTTMVVTCPHDPKKSFPITGAATKYELVIGDIVEILNEVDGVFSSQGSIADSLQKVLYNHRTLSKGIQTCQTVTGKLRHIYFTTMPQTSGESTYLQRIAYKIDESLKEFAKLNASSVAFPAIGTGNLGYPPSRVASQMISRCSDYVKRNPHTSIKKICFVTYWTDEFVYQEFKKLLDVREKHGSASSLPLPSPSCTLQKIIVRFSGLSASDVNDAVTRLQAELKSKLIKDDWSSSPLRISISKLTAEQKVTLTVKAEERDVGIKITTDNIVIEGSNEDVKVLRHEINGILHKSEGSVGKLPVHWTAMKERYAEIKLDPVLDGPEYRKVIDEFNATLQTVGVYVTEITRIQNELLYTQYEAQKMKVSNELQSDSVVVESSLWHGTDASTIRQICTNEFNRSFAGKNATTYGQGSYFATTSNYSLKYAQGYMILAKVATGRYYKGSSSVDRTKLKPGYHSTVNDEANPSIFVVYHDAAAYPEYVIKFSRHGYYGY